MGTITEIYDYLRLLYARAGTPRCPDHDVPLEAQTVSQMVDQVLALPEGRKLMLLAPVIRERKGEHLAVFDELRAQGFVRARVNGRIYEMDELPKLDKQKKHSIDVVVDRFKVRADLQQRLAESFETAINLADGIALVAPMDDEPGEEVIFSARFACPHCGHSISELEPKLFSFNNPAGACPTCDGLGVKQFFDAKRLVNGELTLAEGAIRGWDRRNVYYFQMLGSLAAHYGFSLEKPFDELPAEDQKAILFGSGREDVDFRYLNDRGDIVKRSHPFEGSSPTWSAATARPSRTRCARSWPVPQHPALPGLPGHPPAPRGAPCVGGRDTAGGDRPAGGRCRRLFRRPEPARAQGRDRRQDPQGDPRAPAVPGQRRPGLPDPGSQRRHLSGGEAQRIRLASQIGAGLVG